MKLICNRCGVKQNSSNFRRDEKSITGFKSWCIYCSEKSKKLTPEELQKKEEDKRWIAENQKYDILSIYGRVKIKQNLCRNCKSRFFILSKEDDSPYCSDCRGEILDEAKKGNVKKLQVIFHTEVQRERPNISKKTRLAVYERDNYTCVYCDRNLYDDFINKTGRIQLDHFIPYIGRGEDQIKNLYTACKRCNVSKFSKLFKTVEEVREFIKGKKDFKVEVIKTK